MKKVLTIALCLVLTFVLTIPALAIVYVDSNKATITIDGVLDAGYSGPYAVKSPKIDTNPYAATGQLWVAWDANNLYFYIEVADKTPQHGSDDKFNDNVEFFIDWNAGKGGVIGERNEEDTDWDYTPGNPDGCPYWQVRVYAAPDLDGNQDLGGLTIEGNPGNWTCFDWGAGGMFEEECVFVTAPLNGDWNNGYIIEISMRAPANVTLTEGKQIPIDIQIIDYVADTQAGWGKMFMELYDYNDKQWAVPFTCRGLMTLRGEYTPVEITEPITDEQGVTVEPPPPVTDRPTVQQPPRVGDNAMIIIVLMIALAGAVVLIKRLGKNRA